MTFLERIVCALTVAASLAVLAFDLYVWRP